MPQLIGCCQDQKIPMRNFQGYVIEDFAVIRRLQKPVRFRKPQSLHKVIPELRRQTCTALGTTTGQYLTTIGSGHTGTETVGTLALQDARLKSSFHGEVLTNSSMDFERWLKNRQPKQERHSSQIRGQVQCLSPVLSGFTCASATE